VLVSPARVVTEAPVRRAETGRAEVGRSNGAELAEAARLLRENDEVLGRRTP
jgi:hypothetical protein